MSRESTKVNGGGRKWFYLPTFRADFLSKRSRMPRVPEGFTAKVCLFNFPLVLGAGVFAGWRASLRRPSPQG